VTPTEPRAELDPRFSGPNATATTWKDVRTLVQHAELFWISTVRADVRPHVTPLPAVWSDDALHFCTAASEQKATKRDFAPTRFWFEEVKGTDPG
jgi:nitroimidazol reductase NimA-like FMN-containing flavoprotein (pyridoxamine 5'-phosphate oxidase superfamily)